MTPEHQQQLYQRIAEAVSTNLNMPCSVWIPDQEGRSLRIAAATGLPKRYVQEAVLSLDSPSLTGDAFKTGERMSAYDVLTDDRWKYKDDARDMGWKSALCVPFRAMGKVSGVISIYTFVCRNFSDMEQNLLQGFADQIQQTLEEHRRTETLDRLLEVGQLIEQMIAKEPQAVLQQIVKGACAVTGADCAVLYPYDPRRQDFYDVRSVAHYGLNEPLTPHEKPRTTGMAAYIKREGEVILDDIAARDPAMLTTSPFIQREGIHAFMGIALEVSGDTLGILYVDYRQPHEFAAEGQNTIRLFAHQASIAIQNARFFDQRVALLGIAQDITSIHDKERLLDQVLARSLELLGAECGSICLLNKQTQKLEFQYAIGKERYRSVSMGHGLIGIAAQSRKPVRVGNAPEDPRYVAHTPSTRSELDVPLLIGGELIGVLNAESSKPDAFSPEEENLAVVLAGQAAVAIQNTRLIERLSALYETSDAVGRAVKADEVDQVLGQIVQQACSLIGKEVGYIILVERPTSRLRIVASQALPQERIDAFHARPILAKDGTFKTVIETGELLEIPNAREDPRVLDVGLEIPEALVNVPIQGKQGVLGILVVDATLPDPSARQFLLALADMAAVAIERASLFKQNQELQRLSRVITSHDNLGDMLQAILQGALELVGCPVGSIGLLDKSSGELKFGQAIGQQEYSLSLSDGFTGLAVECKAPVRTGNVEQAERYSSQSPDTVSELSVPIMLDKQVIGVFNVESPLPDAFSDEDEEMLVALASQAAVAIKNAQRVTALEALGEVGASLTSQLRLKPDEIMDLIHAQATRVMDTGNMYIALWDEPTDIVSFPLAYSFGQRIDTEDREKNPGWQRRKAGKGRTEHIIRTRQPLFHATGKDGEEWYAQAGHEEYVGTTFASWIGVPMLLGERVLGVIATFHYERDNVYGPEDLEVLQAMANQAAIALDNAHMFYELNQKLEALVEFSRVITASINLTESEVVELIHSQATKLMDTDNMYIALYDSDPVRPDVYIPEHPEKSKIHGTVRFGLAYVAGERIDIEDEDESSGWQPRQAGKGRTEHIIRTRQPLFQPTKKDSEEWYAQPGHEEYVGSELPSWLGVPMIIGDQVLGVIATYHPDRDHVYDGDDLRILQAMAWQAAIALNNSQLYQRSNSLYEEMLATRQLATLGTVMAALQHRVNNSISLIVPNLDRLKKRIDVDDPTIREIVDIIDRNARHTAQLINRIQEPLQNTESQNVLINAVLSDILADVRDLRGDSTKHLVQVQVDLDESIPIIQAPTGQVSEVFRNLVDNAFNAMPRGGQLVVTSRCRDDKVQVRVRDTGRGIPSRIRERLFVKPAPGGQPGSGTGLGLWLSKLMLQSFGGCVIIEETSLAGTTILVEIPLPGARRREVQHDYPYSDRG